jgi:hypothetical protein
MKRRAARCRAATLLSLASLLGCAAGREPDRWGEGREEVVYGHDDRRDPYTLPPRSPFVTWAQSTAMEVPRTGLKGFSLASRGTFAEGMKNNGMPLCTKEPFDDQPRFPGLCSAFLAGPDLVITAGHCVSPDSCSDMTFVFGVVYDPEGRDPGAVGPDNIYRCSSVVARARESGGADYAIVRLDREVKDRAPLELRRAGRVADDEELVLIGNPAGLPTKISAGARVLDNKAKFTFLANTDSYHGNSGSAVFGAHSGLVEGILVWGEDDFSEKGGCWISRVCPENGAPCAGEGVVRITALADALAGALAR